MYNKWFNLFYLVFFMGNCIRFISLISPCSSKYHAIRDFGSLKIENKILVGSLTGVVALLTFGLLSVLAFRCMVKKFSAKKLPEIPKIQNLTHVITRQELQTINNLKKIEKVEIQRDIIRVQNIRDIDVPIPCNPLDLHQAIIAKDKETVKSLIKKVDVNAQGAYGITALHHAVFTAFSWPELSLELVKLLLDNGADPNIEADGKTPLQHAIMSGNLELIKLLFPLTKKASEVFEKIGFQFLPQAIRSNKLDIVKFLLDQGVAPYLEEAEEQPFFVAAFLGRLEMIRAMILKIKDINCRDILRQTALHKVAKSKNVEIAQILLDHGADANVLDMQGDTPLLSAVRQKSLSLVQCLLPKTDLVHVEKALKYAQESGLKDVEDFIINNDVRLNKEPPKEIKPVQLTILEAVKMGDIEAVRQLLLQKENLAAIDENDRTPLHVALKLKNSPQIQKEIVELLIKNGVDANVKDINTFTALHSAARKGNLEIVKLLVEATQDIDIKDGLGQTALHLAVEKGHVDVVKYLAEKGASMNAPQNSGILALHLAAEKGSTELLEFIVPRTKNINAAAKNGQTALHFSFRKPQALKFLLSKGCDANIFDRQGYLPIHRAILNHCIESVRHLITELEDINVQTLTIHPKKEICFKNTCLHLSMEPEITKILIAKGADANMQNGFGNLPLHEAVREGELEVVRLLVPVTKDLLVKNLDGKTALEIAQDKKLADIAALITEQQALRIQPPDPLALHEAVLKEDIDDIIRLLLQNQKLDEEGKADNNPLHLAFKLEAIELKDQIKIISLLLKTDIDANAKNKKSQQPLHFAAMQGKIETLKLLMPKVNHINERDDYKFTALHYALYLKKTEAVKFLIDHGADPNSLSPSGASPLHIATRHKDLELVRFLCSRIKDINAKNKEGKTALKIAQKMGSQEMIDFLIEKGAKED